MHSPPLQAEPVAEALVPPAPQSPRPCPVCAATSAALFMRAPAERLAPGVPTPSSDYTYFRCPTCEAVFIDPLPSDDEVRVYYEHEEYHFMPPSALAPTSGTFKLGPLRRLQLQLARPVPAGVRGKHLDYGCGTGDYLAFTRAHGLDPVGVEYSDASARVARSRGFPVSLSVDALPNDSFAYISLIHTLEHLPDPAATVFQLARKLAPGGILFVEIPYLDCHEFHIFGRYFSMIQAPLHLQFFTDQTMERLAKTAGLRLLEASNNLWTRVFYLWSLLNVLDFKFGLALSRRRKNQLNALALPAVWIPAAVTSALGMKGLARRYYFVKAASPEGGPSPAG